MKNLMTMMLGLSLVLGGSALFAQGQTDQPKVEKTHKKSTKKASKKKAAKTAQPDQPKAQ